MTQIVPIFPDGSLRLPAAFRKKLGLSTENLRVELSETREGLLIRCIPLENPEDYSDDRMAEFQKNNEEALEPYRSDIDRLAR